MLRRPMLLLILIVLGVTLPFVAKPVHIDDTFVLHITQRILETPTDPFGTEIDWFGHLMPIWRATTNPPLVSYWLAPVAAIFGEREIPLHLAVVPFYLLFAWGAFSLARRFLAHPWLPVLFLVFSAPFLVSGNLMRDVPAAGLAVAGMALFIGGTDDDSARRCALGGLLLGLSILAKYSIGVVLPVIALYALLRRKPRDVFWLAIPVLIVAVWCVQTQFLYGQVHPLYLLLERSNDSNILWEDKWFGGLTILGSALFLQPVILYMAGATRRWRVLPVTVILAVALGAWAYQFYASNLDLQFQLWLFLGLVLIVGAARAVVEERFSIVTIFLGTWFSAHLLFSVFFVPFQAVRHLLVALVPLLILLFRWFERSPQHWRTVRTLAAGLLCLQGVVALAVNVSDYQYADSYRRFARRAVEMFQGQPKTVWFVGHWGWQFYAGRAGFRMMNRDGPYPTTGDVLIWPQKVHVGDVMSANPDLRLRLELVNSFEYRTGLPIRTMNVEAGAGFYATIRRRIPYRFDIRSPLEVFRVYRVMPANPG
jgi:4-amino-4-deoxy-L-arabinose transferase-like glycosyltransferase